MRKNLVCHDRTKYILIKYHFIREAVKDGEIKLQHINPQEQLIDIFTKAFPKERFLYLREKIGVIKESELRGSVR